MSRSVTNARSVIAPSFIAPLVSSFSRVVGQKRQSRRVFLSAHADAVSLQSWLTNEKGVLYTNVVIGQEEEAEMCTEFIAGESIKPKQAVFSFHSSLTITGIDAETDPDVQHLAKDRSELVQLALWLLVHKRMGSQSPWNPYLSALPDRTLSPILWTSEELDSLCFGSPVVAEANQRREALSEEWTRLVAAVDGEFTSNLDESAFREAFTVVLSNTYYLPKAGRFALLPPLFGIRRTGRGPACTVDYDPDTDAVLLTSNAFYKPGDPLRVYDDRSNLEMLLSTGTVEMDNPSDHLFFEYKLVPTDRLYSAKREILESFGYDQKAFQNPRRRRTHSSIPLRLQGIDTQLVVVNFAEDVVVSEMNEYELLQLILGDCRVRLGDYKQDKDGDIKKLQNPNISEKQRVAAKLLLGEKRILQSCLDTVRRRLAPIRGVPVKSGDMEDPNKDILDMFDAIESIPQAPKKLLDGFMSWAKGDYDPEWKSKGKRP